MSCGRKRRHHSKKEDQRDAGPSVVSIHHTAKNRLGRKVHEPALSQCGRPWASSVLGEEEKKGRREEGREEGPDTLYKMGMV